MKLRGIARTSKLSRIQVGEVLNMLPDLDCDITYVESKGDLDQATSLRSLDKDDFFTYELDQALLAGKADFAIHSAKDLPDPMPKGLTMAALTEGVDRADSLVMRPGFTIDSIPSGGKIATSSIKREEAVRQVRGDLAFVDIRGTIERRLQVLETSDVYGVVLAKAALVRLNLLHLNMIDLPGETTPGQGQLAIVCREGEETIQKIFKPIDARSLSRA